MWELLSKLWKTLTSMKDAKGNLGKSWFRSKTLWINIVAVIAVLFGQYVGIDMTGEENVAFLGVVNFILRLITSEPVGFIED